MDRKRFGLVRAGMVVTTACALVAVGVTPVAASPGQTVTDMNTLTAADLVQSILGAGVVASNINYVGSPLGAGTFSGMDAVGFPAGLTLSSGSVLTSVGPNSSESQTTVLNVPGDADLDALLSGGTSLDASVLTFDFVPNTNQIVFDYVFSSEEYSEYSNSSYNDVFGFFVNGTNCALTPDGQPVSVNNINGGNPSGTNAQRPQLYRDNALATSTIDVQPDGLTVVMTCAAAVNAGVPNTMKLAIADVADRSLDSTVFIQGGSFQANTPPSVSDQALTTAQDTPVAVVLSGTDPENDPLTFAVTGAPSHGVLSGSGANLTYTPNAGYSGPDSFTYTASDGAATSNTGTVSITVTPVAPPNKAPSVSDQALTTAQDTPLGITLTGSDPENDPLTFTVTGAPSHGVLSGSGANLTYTPNAGYSGPDSFTYTASDGTNTSNTGTVSITVTPAPVGCTAAAPAVDTKVSAEFKKASSTFKAPALSTSGPNELLVAFIGADGPQNTSQKVTSVSGGRLKWTRAAAENRGWGTTEVWYAYASAKASNVSVTAKLASAYDGAITVVAFTGASSTIGATGTGWGTRGTPAATVTTKACNSLVWAAGHDWTNSSAASAPAGQTLVHTFVDTRVKDTFWTQKVDTATVKAGDKVGVSTNGPTKDRWTMAAVEILPAG